jgi:hypothetical protein
MYMRKATGNLPPTRGVTNRSVARILLFMSLAIPAHVSAQDLVTVQCTGCTTMQQLLNRARGEALDAIDPNGRNLSRFNVFVTSDSEALSAMYLVIRRIQGPFEDQQYYPDISPTTTTLGAAHELDEAVFSRKIEPVQIPADVAESANNAVFEDVNTHLRGVLPVQRLISGYFITDTRTGLQTRLSSTVTVTVKFADGTTAKMVISVSSALLTEAWVLVPGSISQPRTPSSGGAAHNFVFIRSTFGWGRLGGGVSCTIEATVCSPSGCTTRQYRATCR